jgi:hypothetical protein
MFLIRWNEDQGEGDIVAGPPDSFWPPKQWLTGESLPGENIVIWYIPILHGKKSEPWWCAPDPDPNFSPCDAEMRIEPIVEVVPTATATAELIDTVEPSIPGTASATPTRTVEPTTVPTASPTATPLAGLTGGPTSTPRPVAGDTAAEVARNGGCDNCHLIGDMGEAGKVGPDLSSIGLLASQRVAGQSATEFLRTSIVDPIAHIAPDCPNGPCLAGIMPGDYARRLTAEQIDMLVDFLLELKAPITPASEAISEQAPSKTISPATIVTIIALSLLLATVLVPWLLNKRGDS